MHFDVGKKYHALSQHPRNSDVLIAKSALKSLGCLISMSCIVNVKPGCSYVAGFKHRAPVHDAQEGKVDYIYFVWCPSSRSEKYFAKFARSANSCRVFQFSNCSSNSTSNASNDIVFRSDTANAGFLDCRGSSRCVPHHFQRHSTSNSWIGRPLLFIRCAGGLFRTYSQIFALLKQDCGRLCPRMVLRR